MVEKKLTKSEEFKNANAFNFLTFNFVVKK